MSNREKKAAPKGRRTRQRARKSASSLAMSGSLPISMATEFPRFYTNVNSIAHKLHGDGIRASGTLVMGQQYETASAYTAYMASNGSYTYQWLHPHYVAISNSRLWNLGLMYQRYGFRKLKLWYVPSCGSATLGTVALSFNADPVFVSGASTGSTSFAAYCETGNVFVTQPWRPGVKDFTPQLDKEFLGWMDYDAAGTDVTVRQQIQGGFTSAMNVVGGTTGTRGVYVLEYEIEFYTPNRFVDVALESKSRKQRCFPKPPGMGVDSVGGDRRPAFVAPEGGVGETYADAVIGVPILGKLSGTEVPKEQDLTRREKETPVVSSTVSGLPAAQIDKIVSAVLTALL